jgi:hypothetical protein
MHVHTTIVSTTYCATYTITNNQATIHETTIPTYVKDIDLNVHIRVFKMGIKANGETMEVDIIKLFGFILKDNISKWGENFVQNHPNCTFEELEQTFYK